MMASVSPAFTWSPSFTRSSRMRPGTVFLHLHLSLYHFRVAAKGEETDEGHDDYYC